MSDKSAPFPNLIATHQPAFDQHPAAVYLFGLGSERSQRVMGQALRTIASLLIGGDAREADFFAVNWGALRAEHTNFVRARLIEQFSPATANRTLSALRGVLKAAQQLGQISADDYQAAIQIAGVEGKSQPAGRQLSAGEIEALIAACQADTSPAGVRDAAIISLLYPGGLRRSEIVALDIHDFHPVSGALRISSEQNHRQRIIPVQDGTWRALQDWLALLPRADGPLFVPILKSGQLSERRMNAQSIYDLLKKRAAQAGLDDFSPRDLRHTFMSDLLAQGAAVEAVTALAGHASPDTTRRYAHDELILPSRMRRINPPHAWPAVDSG